MSNENQVNDSFLDQEQDAPKLTQGLNILTILTFIGCSILMLFTLATPWLMNFSKEMMQKAMNSGQELTPKQLEDMRRGMEAIALTEKNMVLVMTTGIVGIVLCFVGALMMRKLKKDGYWIYIAGQVLPLVAGLAIMGTQQYSDWKGYFGLAITLLFILLYTGQRKNLVY